MDRLLNMVRMKNYWLKAVIMQSYMPCSQLMQSQYNFYAWLDIQDKYLTYLWVMSKITLERINKLGSIL